MMALVELSSSTVLVGVLLVAVSVLCIAALVLRLSPSREENIQEQDDAGDTAWLARHLTVIVTTSANESNPSTACLETVFSSFSIIPGLNSCVKYVVCDWPVLYEGSESDWTHTCRIGSDRLERYRQYIDNIEQLCLNGSFQKGAPWSNTFCITLSKQHGFGLAVGAAMDRVSTEFVLIVQHDRCFFRPISLKRVVQAMALNPHDLKTVGFTVSNWSGHRDPVFIEKSWGIQVMPRTVDDLELLPLIKWLGSTLVTRVDYYTSDILPSLKVGDTVEEPFGHEQHMDIVRHGMGAHKKYGYFLLLDPGHPRSYAVAHLDFLREKTTEEQCEIGSKELIRLRSMLRKERFNRAKSRKSNMGESQKDKMKQRIGLLLHLSAMNALPAHLRLFMEEIVSLTQACGWSIPLGHSCIMH